MSRHLLGTSVAVAALVSLAAAGCQRVHSTAAGRAGRRRSHGEETVKSLKTLTLTHPGAAKAVVGTAMDATAEGLPPRRKLDLLWQTVKGGWVVEDYYHFRGKKFVETTRPLGQFETGEDGRLAAHFTIPEDYGGVHEVIVSDNGAPLAQGGVEVTQTFEMHPAQGPVGTPIELRVTGLGWRTMESTWVINWDNQEAGWVSATDTHGTAVARIRASGTVGDHQLKVLTGYMGQGYLNHEQAPNAYLPRPSFAFRADPGPHGAVRVRRTVPEAAGARVRGVERRRRRQHRADAGAGAVARDAERARSSGQRTGVDRLGHAGREPRVRQWLRAERGRAEEDDDRR